VTQSMTSCQRVTAALSFRQPDYVPLFDQYWGRFLNDWRSRQGLPPRLDVPLDDIVYDAEDIQSYFGVDLYKAIPVEDPWPGQKASLGSRDGYIVERDGWGRVVQRKPTSPYGHPLEVSLVVKGRLDQLRFESVQDAGRYVRMLAEVRSIRGLKRRPYIFFKIGGPFLRSSFLRGDDQWYMDIAEDPGFCRAVVDRLTDHLIGVAVEAVRRSSVPGRETSIWIFDDIASNRGPLVSPRSYERIFLPAVQRMVAAFKAAGVAQVGFHSDGDVRPILDGLVDAGISILNPVEPRANMDVVTLHRRYGHRLAYVGGLCNTQVLPYGDDDSVRRHVNHVLSVANEGGVVIGSHSISGDISQERYRLFIAILEEHGRPTAGSFSPGGHGDFA
jgi:uroporphyrinogen decarboxylase